MCVITAGWWRFCCLLGWLGVGFTWVADQHDYLICVGGSSFGRPLQLDSWSCFLCCLTASIPSGCGPIKTHYEPIWGPIWPQNRCNVVPFALVWAHVGSSVVPCGKKWRFQTWPTLKCNRTEGSGAARLLALFPRWSWALSPVASLCSCCCELYHLSHCEWLPSPRA